MVEIFIIAIGVSMDAFAVSIASGSIVKKMPIYNAIIIASLFGIFQTLMPILGWFGARFFANQIKEYDHWIAFSLLLFIGLKMIHDATKESENASFDPLNIYIIFTLAIATSIDALAVGVTFSILCITILTASIIIGVTTFIFSFLGVYLGNYIGDKIGNRVEIFGGVILILIGIKIVIEHLFFI